MHKWLSALAIIFVLLGSLALAGCEPPEDMEQQDELEDSMGDGGDDW